MPRIRHSLRSWLWRVDVHQEVDEEIAFHIDMRTRELIARGMGDDAAAWQRANRPERLPYRRRSTAAPGEST